MSYPYPDIRDFLKDLEKEGELKRIATPIKCGRRDESELMALMRYLQNINGPAVILEKLEDINLSGVPMIYNLFGSRKRVFKAFGVNSSEEVAKKLAELKGTYLEPKMIDRENAPCKEVVIMEDNIDLEKQVPRVWHEFETIAYATGGVTVTKDPDTGKRNVGWYRYGFFDLDQEGNLFPDGVRKKYMNGWLVWDPPSGHGGMNYLKARQKNKPLEVAWAGLCDPAIHILGSLSLQYGDDEFAHAGTLRGKPVELVKCETVDLEVPATAEWVIEGEALPEDSYTGTHGQYCGYVDPPWSTPLVRVKCITHRKNPLWYMTCSMFPPFDHYYLLNMLTEAELFNELRLRYSDFIYNVVVHGSLGLFVIQTSVDGAQKPNIEFGKNVIYAVWSSIIRFARSAKYVIVVGPDVNPYDLNQVVWAMSTRCQPYSDSVINRSGEAFILDPSAYELPGGAFKGKAKSEQMGIDALIKVPERFNEYPPVCEPSKESVKRVEAKIKDIFK